MGLEEALSLFGTDGIRGVVNKDLTPDLAAKVGFAAGRWVLSNGLKPEALLARDTRLSGSMLGAALAAGLCEAGVNATAMGVAPTGAVSMLCSRTGAYGLGAVISASHNPAEDNGIKLYGPGGRKMTADAEQWIEQSIEDGGERAAALEVGAIKTDRSPIELYMEWLAEIRPGGLHGLTVAVDCANGSAYELAPKLLERLGAKVHKTSCDPDGRNINAECGATNPQHIQALTRESGADVGVAFDGDADRAIFCGAGGELINGDRAMGIWATQRSAPTVVGTVMSNMGFEQYLQTNGIKLERTPVGDKHVSARILETGAKIGGEQSGHLIFSDRCPSGDGLITMVEVLGAIVDSNQPASELATAFENWPQALVNVQVESKNGWESSDDLQGAIKDAERELEGKGRVLARASGTQPMIRFMVEAETIEQRDKIMDSLVDSALRELGGRIYSRVDLTNALGD